MKRKPTILLEWEKPAHLVDWEREQHNDEPRQSTIRVSLCAAVLFLVTMLSVPLWAPEEFWRIGWVTALTCGGGTIMHYLSIRGMCVNRQESYCLRDDGILIETPSGVTLYPWKRLDSYEISHHPDVPSVRILDFTYIAIDRSKMKRVLFFDFNQQEELLLQSVIETQRASDKREFAAPKVL
jgi:hypothetical protein